MPSLSRDQFCELVDGARRDGPGVTAAVPVSVRLLADQLTPVLAYRRLVAHDERTAPSFLLESIEGGERQGRYSIMGAHPVVEVLARGHVVTVTDRRKTGRPISEREADPLMVLRELVAGVRLMRNEALAVAPDTLPEGVLAGWFGYAAYDTVRYAEPEKLDRRHAPPDDRSLPDMHFGLYDGVVVFDHVEGVVYLVQVGLVGPEDDARAVYDRTLARLETREQAVQRHSRPLPSGRVPPKAPPSEMASNLTRETHAAMVARALEYIRAGDIFQVVLGQRFERRSSADPFDVYRALRAVNPSPYMVYMQTAGCILVASSPEILCRVRTRADGARVVTNRPLAGTRRRGATPEEDAALEAELLADAKERAEHVMLVDLGRNDVGRVAQPGTVAIDRVMEIERYSHVMHISSTVTGALRAGLDCWDALRAALPVGTISGAPKVRAMQIIDELEPVRRGPYGGGMGYAGLDGEMDIALALRTIVVPTGVRGAGAEGWTYHIQAAGGIVADSRADAEYQETVNKAAALARAIDVAEAAFSGPGPA